MDGFLRLIMVQCTGKGGQRRGAPLETGPFSPCTGMVGEQIVN